MINIIFVRLVVGVCFQFQLLVDEFIVKILELKASYKLSLLLIFDQVLYKKFVGNATYGQVSLFLTVLSVFNIVFLWPFVVILYFTGAETIEWDKIPWDYLCGNAALGVGKLLHFI